MRENTIGTKIKEIKYQAVAGLLFIISAAIFYACYRKVFLMDGFEAAVGFLLVIAILLFIAGIAVIRWEINQKKALAKRRAIQRKTYPDEIVESERDYTPLIAMTNILTNGNKKACGEIEQLVQDYAGFLRDHALWCEEMYGDKRELNNRDECMHNLFGYWLVGYCAVEDAKHNPSISFGVDIDWKEAVEQVLWQLDEVVGNLGYPIDTKMINLDGKEFTYEALCIIGAYLHDNNYALLHLVTNSDSYQLFVIREENCMRFMELAEAAGVDFHHVLQG